MGVCFFYGLCCIYIYISSITIVALRRIGRPFEKLLNLRYLVFVVNSKLKLFWGSVSVGCWAGYGIK